MSKKRTDGAEMPRQIPFIIANEGCERFSFYGMRNILQQFLPASMMMMHLPAAAREGAAKEVFHIFVMGVYFFPLLGGYLADRFFGKFNTIFWFSMIYCAGHACLAIFEDSPGGFYTGLFLIALGAGGIKPLVASFVGDQFDERNKHLAKVVFDAFYWIINFGSFFASLLMPFFLDQLGASWAFGIPGALMFVATVVLVAGKRKYVMVAPQPPNPNSFSSVVKTALTTRDQHGALGSGSYLALVGFAFALVATVLAVLALPVFKIYVLPSHFSAVAILCLGLVIMLALGGAGASMQLERARGIHTDEAVNGVRSVLSILVVFALVTPFHSLFDQKATEWVIQGKAMTRPIWEFDLGSLGTWTLEFLPSQMQALNPLLVMILIPFNNLVLYPFLRRRGYEATSLRRMAWGIAFSGLAWIAVGTLQVFLEGGDKLHIFWQALPYALLTFGEVLVSATGLEFAYSQAPLAMKGVIMSFWNLTTTVGGLWVLLVDAGIKNETVTNTIQDAGMSPTTFRMFFFAAFAFAAAIIFKLYVKRYKLLDNYRTREPKVSRDVVADKAAGAAALPEARDVSKRDD